MTATSKVKPSVLPAEALLGQERDLFKQLLKESLQEVLEAEMTEVIGASSGQRTELRSGYRAGYYSRSLVTRIGKLELRIPRDRQGGSPPSSSSATSARRRRWSRPLRRCTCRASPRARVKAVTEELCGHAFSASTISQINKGLDAALARFAGRPLEEEYPYLILDARYEKVRIDGVIRSQAVQIAIGINWEVAARSWPSSLPTARVVRIFPNPASCLRLVRPCAPKRTRPGSKTTATSTWNCSRSKRRPP